jgi:hypothetical protein
MEVHISPREYKVFNKFYIFINNTHNSPWKNLLNLLVVFLLLWDEFLDKRFPSDKFLLYSGQ